MNPKFVTGTARLIDLVSVSSTAIVFLYNGYILLLLGIVAGLFSMLGNYIGATLVINKSSNIVKYCILFVLILLFYHSFLQNNFIMMIKNIGTILKK